jgi:hypothetical protein
LKAAIHNVIPKNWKNADGMETIGCGYEHRLKIKGDSGNIHWSQSATEVFQNLVIGPHAPSIKIYFDLEIDEILPGNKVSVELLRCIPDDSWIKIYEPIGYILVSKQHAKYRNSSSETEKIKQRREKINTMRENGCYRKISEILTVGSIFNIGGVDIVSPYNINFQIVSYEQKLEDALEAKTFDQVQQNLTTLLDKQENIVSKNPNYFIHLPFDGLPCLYHDIDKKGRFLRRTIIMQNSVKIDGGPLSSLSIKDVDTGEILNNCDPESLRILPVCLYHIPPLMVKCSLFNIRAPPRFNSWNEKFVEALNHIISELLETSNTIILF